MLMLLMAFGAALHTPSVHMSVTIAASTASDEVSLRALLSTCVNAAERGCLEIRRVHDELGRSDGSVLASSDVDYKIEGDARSALTAADLASQSAVIDGLCTAWPGLRIVGEEDLPCDVTQSGDAACGSVCSSQLEVDKELSALALRCDLCDELPPSVEPEVVLLRDVTVFVDPLDGTREFVEGRVENVQCLVGIAVNGYAVAGAVGLPFSALPDAGAAAGSPPVVMYALVGAGLGCHHGDRSDALEPAMRGGDSVPSHATPRPLLVTGDVEEPALSAAYSAALSSGGRRVPLGGTGQKCLAVAEGRADVAIMNLASSSWDTCAPEALVRAAGGEVTDLFGERLIHQPTPPHPATYLNGCGVIASTAAHAHTHERVCAAMRKDRNALARLAPWGLDAGVSDADAVERVLRARRETLAPRGRAPSAS